MDRRKFLAGISALVGGLAVNAAIPFGRVWSFPSKIVIPKNPFDYSDNLQRALIFQREALVLTEDEIRERYLIPAMDALWDDVDRKNAALLAQGNVFAKGEVGTLYGFDLP